MRNLQEAKLNMYNAVISFCNSNMAIISSVPALQSAFTSLNDTVTSIVVTAQQEAQIISGITADKKNLRIKLVNETATIAANVFAYATSLNNNELKQKVDFSPAALLKIREEELPALCMNILKAVNANLAALSAYNITADTMAQFNFTIEEFSAAVPRPRNAVSSRSAYVRSLKELHKTADSILKHQMDKIMQTFIGTNPEFYYTYTSNRLTVDPVSTPTQLRGIITNKNNNQPIPGAVITVVEYNITVTSDSNGRYTIKPLAHGTYSVTIAKEGFLQKVITGVQAKLGHITVANVALSASTTE